MDAKIRNVKKRRGLKTTRRKYTKKKQQKFSALKMQTSHYAETKICNPEKKFIFFHQVRFFGNFSKEKTLKKVSFQIFFVSKGVFFETFNNIISAF